MFSRIIPKGALFRLRALSLSLSLVLALNRSRRPVLIATALTLLQIYPILLNQGDASILQAAYAEAPKDLGASSQPNTPDALDLLPGQPCSSLGTAGSSVAEISHLLAADAGQVISVAKGGHLCIWRGLKSVPIGRIADNFSAVALDPVSRRLAVAVGQQVSILSLQDDGGPGSATQQLQTVNEIKQIGTGVSALDFHPDGESLLIGGLDGKIYRWRLTRAEHGLLQTERNENLERYFGHSAVISALAMHSFGNIFISGDWNGVLSIWALYDADAARGKLDSDLMPGKYFSDAADRILVERSVTDEIIAIRLSLDGELFALATAGGTIEVWKVRGVKRVASIQAHKGDIFAFDLDRSGRNLVSLGRDGLLKRWELSKPSIDGKAATVGGGANVGASSKADRKDDHSEMVLKLRSVNSDRGFSAVAFDVSGKVVVGGRDGKVLRQR